MLHVGVSGTDLLLITCLSGACLNPSGPPLFSLARNPHCLVLVGSTRELDQALRTCANCT